MALKVISPTMIDGDASILTGYLFFAHLGILSGLLGILAGLVLLIIGILVIVLIVGALIVFLPSIIVAIIVWFLTGSLLLAGIAFLVVAVISLAAV